MASLQVLEAFKRLTPVGPIGLNIAQFLRDAIIRNQLVPGQGLPEAEVSTVMGVSRQPVRDALIRLSEAGLLKVLPQRGSLVTRISVPGVYGGRFVRQAVERAVIRETALKASDADIRRMHRLIDEQEEALARGDHSGFLGLDDDMHQAFALSMGHEAAWTALAAVKLQMDRVRYLSIPLEATPGAVLIAQHRAIVDAVAKRDPEAAEKAVEAHLSEILSSVPMLVGRYPEHFDKGE